MKRFGAISLVAALLTSPVLAQPAKKPAPRPKDPYADPPKPRPGKPADPYTEAPRKPGKPADPYADAPKAKPGKPSDPYGAEPPPPRKPTTDVPYGARPASTPPAPARPRVPTDGTPRAPYGSQPGTPSTAPVSAKPTDPYADAAPAIPKRVELADTAAVQALLASQRLDGWLLYDREGANPIAARLVGPERATVRPWFYLIPAKGTPVAIAHASELGALERVPGKKVAYSGYRELDAALRAALKGMRVVAVEYSAKAAVPAMSRVDAGTLELVKSVGVQVRSSHILVQHARAIWGEAGRTAHHVAAHHLVELRKDALAYVARQLRANAPVNELDVQQRLVRGMQMRGLVGPPPVVAAGVNTADPYYATTAQRAAPIRRGDIVVIGLAGKLDRPDGVYAAQTWTALADVTVRDEVAQAFAAVVASRDAALALLRDRLRRRRAVTGAEVDGVARKALARSSVASSAAHRTGHSIDQDLQGSGADLDDLEVKDTRVLVAGTGVTIGPGIYVARQYGVRSEVSVYLSPSGPEVTTPAQTHVEALLATP